MCENKMAAGYQSCGTTTTSSGTSGAGPSGFSSTSCQDDSNSDCDCSVVSVFDKLRAPQPSEIARNNFLSSDYAIER